MRANDPESAARGHTIPELARRWRVSPDRVRLLIRRGLLEAVALPGPRPRLVVTPDQLARFERGATAATPPTKPARQRRRTQLVDYYAD